MIIFRIISALIGYAFGNISFGYLYGKSKNVDLQKEGSGNIGTTNTLRILGVKAGAVTLFCDCMKAVCSALIAWAIFANLTDLGSEELALLRVYAGFGAMMGHDFPVVLRFRGGKGVASGLGFLLVALPQSVPIGLGVFILVVAITRYVSLGSILAVISVVIQTIIFIVLGIFPYEVYSIEASILIIAMPLLVIFLHHENIKRLLNHKENRFTFHPNVKKEEEKQNG